MSATINVMDEYAPDTSRRKTLIASIIIAASIFVLVFAILGLNSGNSSPQKQSGKIEVVSATQLFGEYEGNSLSADAFYKGKVIEVRGTIESMGKDLFGTPYVCLMTGYGGCVQCLFPRSNVTPLLSVGVGRFVKIRGKVSGKTIYVIMKECELVS